MWHIKSSHSIDNYLELILDLINHNFSFRGFNYAAKRFRPPTEAESTCWYAMFSELAMMPLENVCVLFDAILTGRQSGQKLQSLNRNPKLNFAQFVNHNVKIFGGRLNSPSFKDLAWVEDAHLISRFFSIFICKFRWVEATCGKKNYRQMYGKFRKLTERLLTKLHPSNLVKVIVFLVS